MNKKYNVLYADPPWSYKSKKTGGSFKSGSVQQYETLTTDEICRLNVQEYCDKNAMCFLWGTVPMMPDAFAVLDAWGFKYKTTMFWDKQRFGLGYWFRGQVEVLLFGIRGKVPCFKSRIRNIHAAKSEKHSSKPAYFRGVIDTQTAAKGFDRKLELFARDAVPGWDAWGDEIKTDIKMIIKPDFEKGRE